MANYPTPHGWVVADALRKVADAIRETRAEQSPTKPPPAPTPPNPNVCPYHGWRYTDGDTLLVCGCRVPLRAPD
jgi:hypothetical protein